MSFARQSVPWTSAAQISSTVGTASRDRRNEKPWFMTFVSMTGNANKRVNTFNG